MIRKLLLGTLMLVGACGSGHGSPAAPPAASPTDAAPLPAVAHPFVGMNLSAIAYGSSEAPFLDYVKTAAEWSADNNAPVTLDADGWPLAVPAGADHVSAAFYLGTMAGQGRGTRLRVSWDGSGDLSIFGTSPDKPRSGDTVAVNDGMAYGGLTLRKIDPANHLRNLSAMRIVKGQDPRDIFNPQFIDKTRPWGVLRFMDWNRTNGNDAVHWSDRTQSGAGSWATARTGVPYEAEIALANKLRAGPWINVPVRADDDYIRQLAVLVRDRLDPTLTLHLELSNEVWNGGFAQNKWAQERADALWGGHVDHGAQLWYGYRAAQMAAIAHEVFGGDAAKRLSCVIATQTPWHGLEQPIFEGVTRAKKGEARALFRDYAITTYWGGQLATGDDKERATVLGWARGGEAGLTQAFAEIEHGGALATNDSLAAQVAHYQYHSRVAAAHGLRLVAYEGGFGAVAFAYPMPDHPTMVDFFKRLENDPRMGRLYARMVSDFGAAGGSELSVYNDVGGPSIWGTWGTSDDLFAPSVRYDALKAAAAAATR